MWEGSTTARKARGPRNENKSFTRLSPPCRSFRPRRILISANKLEGSDTGGGARNQYSAEYLPLLQVQVIVSDESVGLHWPAVVASPPHSLHAVQVEPGHIKLALQLACLVAGEIEYISYRPRRSRCCTRIAQCRIWCRTGMPSRTPCVSCPYHTLSTRCRSSCASRCFHQYKWDAAARKARKDKLTRRHSSRHCNGRSRCLRCFP